MDKPADNGPARAPRFPFDAIYKALFRDPATVADMLEHYLPEPIGSLPADLPAALDLRSLRQLPSEWVSREFRLRRGDLVWYAEFRPEAIRSSWPERLFIHLEFQSADHPEMALRFQEYGAELLRELRASGAVARTGPCAILCVAVHNGRTPWRAPTSVAGMVCLPPVFGPAPQPPTALAPFYPWGYHALDLWRHRSDVPVPGSIVSMIVGIEYAGHERLPVVLGGPLRETVRELGPGLRATVAGWLRRLAERYGIEPDKLEELMRVPPVTSRLEETLDAEFAKARSDGWAQGLAAGRAEECARLVDLIALKFGRPVAEDLAAPLEALAHPESLRRAGAGIIECDSADELLARIRVIADP
ncbi:MAG: Rpn family recombination-promoting nuclease/putative transposase [Gammaproteobacteria bacterium]|nr:Rpn family recombination-promoting nuclease/putative transposase [Gammaproteobacteria bacterium]